MASIASAVRRIKDDPHAFLHVQMIHDACRRAGHVWRQRVLDPVTTIGLFLVQVLHGNVACRRTETGDRNGDGTETGQKRGQKRGRSSFFRA